MAIPEATTPVTGGRVTDGRATDRTTAQERASAALRALAGAHAWGRVGSRAGVFLNSYSEILFLNSRWAGAALLAVTLLNPHVGLAGLASVLAAYGFARLIGMQEGFLASGFFTYNALLVGLSVGYLFAMGPLTLFLVATAGVLTFLFSVTFNGVFALYLKLPILSLPFVVVSSITYLASQGYGGLYVAGPYVHAALPLGLLPPWLEGFLTALGAILFTPQPLAGAVVAAVILLHSRILFLLALLGYYLGALLTGLLDGLPWGPQLFGDINHFNYVLIAMALGGVFLVPAPRSYLIAAVGVAVATLLLSAVRLFWATHGIPAFTLPFNLVTLTALYVLGSVGFPLVAPRVRATPEETLDDYLGSARRFGPPAREIALPFAGQWQVWQAFDGDWTHRGSWRHAYDFVLVRDGRTHLGDGSRLEEYHAWGRPVLAPCRGRVVRVIANLPDNPPGHVDSHNNWGNLVIIETPAGWCVELSHFAHESIRVREGEWVEPGAELGRCGNSGYSAQPHIHVQVQAGGGIGAVTLPFRFSGYLEGGLFTPHGLPAAGARVEPLFADRGLEFRTAFPLESRLRYRRLEGGRECGHTTFTVRMTGEGESCLDSGRGRLYFARDGHSFYFYRLEGSDPDLALLFAALPRLPLTYRHDLQWHDAPPLAAVACGWRRRLYDLLRAWNHDAGASAYRARWARGGVVEGALRRADGREELVEVVLHPRLGFSQVRLGERRLLLEEVTP